jgi:hypothetical protein
MDGRVKPGHDSFGLAILHPHSNIRGSLFMVVGMASFTMNDAITKAVSSEMNFGQVMLVRGMFATVLIAALAFHCRAMRSPRTSMMKPVALRVAAEVAGTIAFLTAIVNLPLANTAAIFQARPARPIHAARRIDHCAVRPLRLLPRAQTCEPVSRRQRLRAAAGRGMTPGRANPSPDAKNF